MTAPTLTLVHDCSSHTDYPSRNLTLMIATVLISDNSLLCSALRHILSGTPFVMAEAVSAVGLGQLQDVVPEPALVIIDASQNTGRVPEVVRQAKERFPQARIVALADQFDLSFVRTGYEAGVNGFCL
jgi:two-component system, NarL family, nitrate/nitrite response regulator NarL